MGERTVLDGLRDFIAGVSFKCFLWAIRMTPEEYWLAIWTQEEAHKNYKETEHE